jgi:hypothetical protein
VGWLDAHIARANRRVYRALVEPLTDSHRAKLDELLKLKAGSSITWLTWLRQAPLKPNSRHMLEHIERLKTFQLVDLPEALGRHIHQNRLLKLAREGGQMTPKDLGKFEPQRRYATLAAVVLESTATVIDELVDLHDRILVKLFSGAKHKHQQQFQKQGKAINDKVRLYSKIGQALLEAKESGSDPYAAIEAVIPWDEFTESVSEAELLARPEGFDHLHLVGENFATLRRYTPALLEVLELRAAPAAQGVLAAVQTLREMNADNLRKVPADAPTAFIKPRWRPLVITPEGLDRRFYEICALSELKNALRSGDIWVKGSRQFRDFDDYLLPAERFAALKHAQALPLAINPNSNQYLEERLQLLDEQLATVTRLAKDNELPDAILTESGLKITPLDSAVPNTAQALIDQTSQLLPRIKITELLMDVDDWTGFSRHFTHLKDGAEAKDRTLLLSAILGDAINLGLTKMAESSPGLTYAKLSWLQAWHIRDETYSAALAELVNHQYRHAFAAHWGDGTTSSSDGQRFRAGGRGEHRARQPEVRQRARTAVLHPHLRPIRAVQHTRGECRRPRFHLCARRPAVSRVRPADRGALHRHGRFHRSRLRPDAPAGLPLRAAHPRPRRNQTVRAAGRAGLPDAAPADRWHPEHQARAPIGTTSCAWPARSSRAPLPPR